jgi:hypothetical protein
MTGTIVATAVPAVISAVGTVSAAWVTTRYRQRRAEQEHGNDQ